MHRIKAGGVVAGLLALATLAITPAEAQPQTSPDCDDAIRLVEHSYAHAGAEYASIPDNLTSGANLTVQFRLEGCGEIQLSLVSYEAQADFSLTQHELVDVDTSVYAEGDHNLTVTVPPCFFEIDFVFGAALEHFVGPGGTYHGQDRIIASARGGAGCGEVKVDVCPPSISATTRGDASVELEWNSTIESATHLVYRSEGGGTPQLLGEATADGMVDTSAKAATAYTYELAVVVDDEKIPCASVQVGSMPSFPTVVGAVMATTLGLIGYTWMRRRS